MTVPGLKSTNSAVVETKAENKISKELELPEDIPNKMKKAETYHEKI